MPLETAFRDLNVHLQQLRDALLGLRLVTEDKPLEGDAVLVDIFGDAAADLLGWLEDGLIAANAGLQGLDQRIDVERSRRELTNCQERFNRIAHRFSSDLLSYERIAELKRLGRQRQGEWLAWAKSVKQALDACKQPLYDVSQTLFSCWQEMTARPGLISLSVQATNVGQQITVPQDREVAREVTT
jgi:hypothetical protein